MSGEKSTARETGIVKNSPSPVWNKLFILCVLTGFCISYCTHCINAILYLFICSHVFDFLNTPLFCILFSCTSSRVERVQVHWMLKKVGCLIFAGFWYFSRYVFERTYRTIFARNAVSDMMHVFHLSLFLSCACHFSCSGDRLISCQVVFFWVDSLMYFCVFFLAPCRLKITRSISPCAITIACRKIVRFSFRALENEWATIRKLPRIPSAKAYTKR